MIKRLLLPLLIVYCCTALAQSREAGPVLEDYGAVWRVEGVDFPTDTSEQFYLVFDIMDSPASAQEQNARIATAARFLNMHAAAGVPLEQMKLALVVHNAASKDLLNNEAYSEMYGSENPNSGLIQALMANGVEVVFCGQSSYSRKIPKEELIPGVKLALSAMTALVQYQNRGYRLIKF